MSILCTVGPPTLFTLTALSPRVESSESESSESATLTCEFNSLNHQQFNSYHWQWKFQDREIKENGRYKVFYKRQPPNVCQQSKRLVTLRITNVSKEDLGQYLCALQLSNTTLAEKDVPFYDFGKFSHSCFKWNNMIFFNALTYCYELNLLLIYSFFLLEILRTFYFYLFSHLKYYEPVKRAREIRILLLFRQKDNFVELLSKILSNPRTHKLGGGDVVP